MYRDGLACVPKRLWDTATEAQIQSAVSKFNQSVDDYNQQLQSLIKEADEASEGKTSITFLPWKGIREHHPHHLRDGLHLTDQYMEVYWNNMRRNVIREVKKARPLRPQDVEKYRERALKQATE